MNFVFKRSFTIIELLVAIAVFGLLVSIVLVSLKGVKEKAKIAKAQQEIGQIMRAMYLFKNQYGELPPIGNSCSACDNPCRKNDWLEVMDALVNEGLIGRIDKDPWGNYYCYDDNDGVCCGGCTPLYSMGPNGVNDTWDKNKCEREDGCPRRICNDDIGMILPEQ
jgi:type II secretion system protein G